MYLGVELAGSPGGWLPVGGTARRSAPQPPHVSSAHPCPLRLSWRGGLRPRRHPGCFSLTPGHAEQRLCAYWPLQRHLWREVCSDPSSVAGSGCLSVCLSDQAAGAVGSCVQVCYIRLTRTSPWSVTQFERAFSVFCFCKRLFLMLVFTRGLDIWDLLLGLV